MLQVLYTPGMRRIKMGCGTRGMGNMFYEDRLRRLRPFR